MEGRVTSNGVGSNYGWVGQVAVYMGGWAGGVFMGGWTRWVCKYGWVGSVGVRIGGWARRGC